MLKSSKPIPLSSIKQALQNVLHIEHSYKNDIVNERIEKILSNTKEYNALLYNKIPSRYNDDELSK